MEYDIVEEKMEKAIAHLADELANIRAGRANPAILNKITVEYYGAETPINQIAAIAVPEARQIQITPWDRGVIGNLVKAINMAELGLNPINDGNSIRLVFPELNEQRRKELVKECKSLGEDSKVAIRNIRRDSIDIVKSKQKNNEITEDELKVAEDKIQKITDKDVANIDNNISNKEKEILEV